MGLAPVPGLIRALRQKPKRLDELRRRELALIDAHRALVFGSDRALPAKLTVLQALEFAYRSKWELNKPVSKALERARYESRARVHQPSALPAPDLLPGGLTYAVDLNATVTQDKSEHAGAASPAAPSKGDTTLRVIVGALALVAGDLAKRANLAVLLNPAGQVNMSQLAERVIAFIDREESLRGGFGKSNISQLMAKAVKQFPTGIRATGHFPDLPTQGHARDLPP